MTDAVPACNLRHSTPENSLSCVTKMTHSLRLTISCAASNLYFPYYEGRL